MYTDDAVDLLEDMPANVVNHLLDQDVYKRQAEGRCKMYQREDRPYFLQ